MHRRRAGFAFRPSVRMWPGAGGALICLCLVMLLVAVSPAVSEPSTQETRDYQAAVGLLSEGQLPLARYQFQQFLKQYPKSRHRSEATFGIAETYYREQAYDTATRFYLDSMRGDTMPITFRRHAFVRGIESADRSGRGPLVSQYVDQIDTATLRALPGKIRRRVDRILPDRADDTSALRWAQRNAAVLDEANYWRLRSGRLWARREAYSRALEALAPLLAQTSPDPEALLLKADIVYAQNQLDTAAVLYRRLTDTGPTRFPALYGLAWVKIDRGDLEGARGDLRVLTEQSAGRHRVLAARDLARLARETGDHEGAEDWYLQSIRWADDQRRPQLLDEFGQYLDSRRTASG